MSVAAIERVLDVTVELATKLPEDQSPLSRTKLPAPTKDVVEE